MDAQLDQALKELDTCYLAYQLADDEGRRQLNQALFERLFIVDDKVSGTAHSRLI